MTNRAKQHAAVSFTRMRFVNVNGSPLPVHAPSSFNYVRLMTMTHRSFRVYIFIYDLIADKSYDCTDHPSQFQYNFV